MFLLIPLAFIAGVLTAFTPCALPVLPIVLASGLQKRSRTLGVILGLVIVFALATLLLSTIVAAFGLSPDAIRNFSVVLLFIIGLLLAFPQAWIRIQAKIEQVWHPPTLGADKQDFLGGFLTGGSLGIVWTPCVGPIVAVVTALTASDPFSVSAVAITFAYAAGIGVSLWYIARGGAKASENITFIKRNNEKIRQWFGFIIMVTAVMIGLKWDLILLTWTTENLPEVWTQAGSLLQDNEIVKQQLRDLRQ
jgi:cytochrome c-type biogenesis protein